MTAVALLGQYGERAAACCRAPARGAVRALLPLGACLVADPEQASAHVKWFAPFNVAGAPAPLPEVFTPLFVAMLLASVLLVFVVHAYDRASQNSAAHLALAAASNGLKERCPDIMRVTLGGFLLSLWVAGGIILTPEIKTEEGWIPWLQFAMALSTVTWRTTWIAGAGLFVLYGLAIAAYGVFHLLDYPLFIGIGLYLIIHSLRIERLLPHALSILYVAMAATLLWASVEKWAYASWTLPLLAKHQRITLGIDHTAYLVLAGFVEFVASFLLLYGRASQRLVAFMLLVIFVAAVIDFGKIDAIGHAMIIAALAVAVLAGNTGINRWLQKGMDTLWIGGLELVISYLAALFLYFIAYYGLHGLIYGSLG